MTCFTIGCKTLPAIAAKCLFYGSGGGTRTPDTRIMIPSVSLFSNNFFVNHRPNPPALTDSGLWSVNR